MRRANQLASLLVRRIVVIVDDDSRIRESLQSLFDSAGVAIHVCSEGLEALQVFKKEPVGCLVLDIHMEGADGWEIQRIVAESYPQVPVIFITAHGDHEIHTRALSLGAFAFLYKPFDGEQLIAVVANAMELGATSRIVSD